MENLQTRRRGQAPYLEKFRNIQLTLLQRLGRSQWKARYLDKKVGEGWWQHQLQGVVAYDVKCQLARKTGTPGRPRIED